MARSEAQYEADELLRAAPMPLHHEDHVRIAFTLLDRHDFAEASAALCKSLKRMATEAGTPQAFHHTITFAFMAVIAERISITPGNEYSDFIRANPDLLNKRVLERWYSADRLFSPNARATLILPEPTPP